MIRDKQRLVACLACLLAAVLGWGHPHRGRFGRFETRAAGPYPSDWFFAQRAFPRGDIPLERWQAAVEQARVEQAALGGSGAGPLRTGTNLTWEPIGPRAVGGRVTAIAAPPGGIPAYLGSAAGGVFKSSDGGSTWSPVFDATGIYSIGAVALDPTNPDVVYVGTGEANASGDSYPGAGVYKSTNGGQSWIAMGLPDSRHVGRIAIDPQDPQRLYVAALGQLFTSNPERGLYRSEDGGQSWQQVLFVDDSTGVVDVALNPAHPETVFAASWTRRRTAYYRRTWGSASGVWRSIDHGASWTRLTNGLPTTSNVGRISLTVAASQPRTLYAQIIDSSGDGLGFYRSTNGGDSWSRRDVLNDTFIQGFGGFGWYFGTTCSHPSSMGTVWALGQVLLRATDGGSAWSNVTAGMHVDFHAMWIDPSDPQHMYAGSDGGFYQSANGGSTWTHAANLPISQFYAGDIDQQNLSQAIGGTQDNGSLLTSSAPLGAWSEVLGGDGFYSLIDPSSSSVMFVEYQYCSGGEGPYRSTNGGVTFAPAATGLDPADRFNWSTPMAFAPANPQVLVLGSHRVYRTVNQGGSWTPISPDLTGGPYVGGGALVYGTLTTLAVAPSNSDVVYAGTDDGRVWVTTNAGGSWTPISAGLPLRWVTRVAVDPNDPQLAYVTLSGYRQAEEGAHVFRTDDGGQNWTDISSNLPDAPVNDIVVDPDFPDHLFLATDIGVYVTLDQGGGWFPLGLGMPRQTVFDIALHRSSHTLVAFTHGRSAWRLDLSFLPVAVGAPVARSRLALAVAPNPSTAEVTLAVDLAAPARVALAVFDAQGRRIADFGERDFSAGHHRVMWDGRQAGGGPLPAGAYYARAVAPGAVIVKAIHHLR